MPTLTRARAKEKFFPKAVFPSFHVAMFARPAIRGARIAGRFGVRGEPLGKRNLSLFFWRKGDQTDASESVTENVDQLAEEAVSTTKKVLSNIGNMLEAEERKFDDALGFDAELATKQELVHSTNLTSDQIGYLQSVGLADGYWPSDIIQQTMEYVHVYSGMPWWATIAATTIGFRVLLFPLFMKSSNAMAISQRIAPETKEIKDQLKKAMAERDSMTQQKLSAELKNLNKKNGFKYRDMLLSPVTQMVYSVGAFFGAREMGTLPVQGFETQGTLWFENLAAPDPYIGLHLISSTLYAVAFKFGGDTGTSNFSPTMKKAFMVLPYASILVTYDMTAAVMVYFAANGLFSIVQSQLLRNASFRKMANMVPMMDPKEVEKQRENKGMMDNINDTWKDMQESTKRRVEKNEEVARATEIAKTRGQGNVAVIRKKKNKY